MKERDVSISRLIGVPVIFVAFAISLLFQTTLANYISLAIIVGAILVDISLTRKENRVVRMFFYIIAIGLAFLLLKLHR
ncbi:hypothetical protein [Planococcus glaciei]|uniref:Uncharacterized protein n=1 Tax=Planococcus glaciei TaxID=459472 RepID=A0A7H8QF26_9BACL|nr:hypothetical protein [Planococcus glaciei]ETP68150.1 hypothetical protein G159_13920 [Planococcus glaciei CHR43]MBX0315950.1 hypothetical protein [Planococcus glaciei]QKX52055.1 hypothetical protein HF394_16550 [Planococcus glaciei]